MQNAASEHSTARLPTSPQLADHATSPPLTAAVTANHTARACLRGRPASGAGRVAACCGAGESSAVLPIPLLIGLSTTCVHDMSVPSTIAAVDLTTTTVRW